MNGNFTPDDQMPGIPGGTGSDDGIDAEVVAFVDPPAGWITLGVNSDDGFRAQAGYINKPADALFLGEFDGARGTADTTFSISAPDDLQERPGTAAALKRTESPKRSRRSQPEAA